MISVHDDVPYKAHGHSVAELLIYDLYVYSIATAIPVVMALLKVQNISNGPIMKKKENMKLHWKN